MEGTGRGIKVDRVLQLAGLYPLGTSESIITQRAVHVLPALLSISGKLVQPKIIKK